MLTISVGLSAKYISQKIEKSKWGEYEFRVIQDNVYWYTNDYIEENGCISFKSNYDTQVNWCEKYMVEENYWYNNNPSLMTVWFGY